MNGGKTGGEKWRVKDDGRVFDLLPTIFHQLSLCVQTYEREPWPTSKKPVGSLGPVQTTNWVILLDRIENSSRRLRVSPLLPAKLHDERFLERPARCRSQFLAEHA